MPPSNYFSRSHPFVHIIEQPSKSVRFRYLCEERPGTISGVSSTSEYKVPFTIEIVGYQGHVVVIVSCVTLKQPYKPHPYILSGPDCKDGYCTLRTDITYENSRLSFPKLAIQCVKKKELKEALRIRQQKNIDPFLTGFEHANDVNIDLNVVRLCIQVFLKEKGKDLQVLNPIVSEPIHNKRTIPNPLIYKLSHYSCYVNGNVNGKQEEIILLCTKVLKADISIRFYEVKDSILVWQDYGLFKSDGIFNYTAICFKPPKYYNQNITTSVKVCVQLVRVSDKAASPPIEFEYLPLYTKPENPKNPFFYEFIQSSQQCVPRSNEDFDNFLHETSLNSALSPLKYPFKETAPCPTGNYNYFDGNPTQKNTTPMSPLTEILADIDALVDNTTGSDFNIINGTIGSSRQTHAVYNDIAENSDCNIINVPSSCNEKDLPIIHLSSGDLEMWSMERLSGSFQENLSI